MQAMTSLLGQTLGAAFMALSFFLSADRGSVLALWAAAGFSLLVGVASTLSIVRHGGP
jgi:hypothetical protein